MTKQRAEQKDHVHYFTVKVDVSDASLHHHLMATIEIGVQCPAGGEEYDEDQWDIAEADDEFHRGLDIATLHECVSVVMELQSLVEAEMDDFDYAELWEDDEDDMVPYDCAANHNFL